MTTVADMIRGLREQAILDDDPALRIQCDVALTGRDSYLDNATPDCLDAQGRWDYSGAGYSHRELRAIARAQGMMQREAQLHLVLRMTKGGAK